MSAVDTPGNSRPLRRTRWVRYLIVGLAVCLLLSLAAWWLGIGLPRPPQIDTSDREAEIGAAIEASRSEVLKKLRSGAAWGNLGMILLAHDYESPARICLAQAAELDAQDPRWTYLHGRLIGLRDPAAALPFLRRAAELSSANSAASANSGVAANTAARLYLAETLHGLGRVEEAAAEFGRVLKTQPDNPRARLGMGQVAYQQGQLDEALTHAQRAVAAVPQLRSAHALLAEIHRRRGDTAGENAEIAALAVSEDLEWPDPYMLEVRAQQVGSPAAIARASRLANEGKQGEAVAVLRAAVRSAPTSFRARVLLGQLLAAQGDLVGAEAELREALALQPDSFEAQGELGVVQQRLHKFSDAADGYRRVLSLKPNHTLAHFNLALCQEKLGDRGGAIASLRSAVNCKPDFTWGHHVLGRLLAEGGQDAEALVSLELALRLEPENRETKELLTQVKGRLSQSEKKRGK